MTASPSDQRESGTLGIPRLQSASRMNPGLNYFDSQRDPDTDSDDDNHPTDLTLSSSAASATPRISTRRKQFATTGLKTPADEAAAMATLEPIRDQLQAAYHRKSGPNSPFTYNPPDSDSFLGLAGDRHVRHPRLHVQGSGFSAGTELRWGTDQVDIAPMRLILVVTEQQKNVDKPSHLRFYIGTAAPDSTETLSIKDNQNRKASHSMAGREVYARMDISTSQPTRKPRLQLVNQRNSLLSLKSFALSEQEKQEARQKIDRLREQVEKGDSVAEIVAHEVVQSEAHIHFQNQWRPWGCLVPPFRLDYAQVRMYANDPMVKDLNWVQIGQAMATRKPQVNKHTTYSKLPTSFKPFVEGLYKLFCQTHGDPFETVQRFWKILQQVCAMSYFKSCPWTTPADHWARVREMGESWIPPDYLDSAIWLRAFHEEESPDDFFLRHQKEEDIHMVGKDVVRLDHVLTLSGELQFIFFRGGFILSACETPTAALITPTARSANPSSRTKAQQEAPKGPVFHLGSGDMLLAWGSVPGSTVDDFLGMLSDLPPRKSKGIWPRDDSEAIDSDYIWSMDDPPSRSMALGLLRLMSFYEKQPVLNFPWRIPPGAEEFPLEDIIAESFRHCPQVFDALVTRLCPPAKADRKGPAIYDVTFSDGGRSLFDPLNEKSTRYATSEEARWLFGQLLVSERAKVTRHMLEYQRNKGSQVDDEVQFLQSFPREAEIFKSRTYDGTLPWNPARRHHEPASTGGPASVARHQKFAEGAPPNREQVQFITDILRGKELTQLRYELDCCFPNYTMEFLKALCWFDPLPPQSSDALVWFQCVVDFLSADDIGNKIWPDSARTSHGLSTSK